MARKKKKKIQAIKLPDGTTKFINHNKTVTLNKWGRGGYFYGR